MASPGREFERGAERGALGIDLVQRRVDVADDGADRRRVGGAVDLGARGAGVVGAGHGHDAAVEPHRDGTVRRRTQAQCAQEEACLI